MGGKNEQVIETPAEKGLGNLVGKTRVHESAGFIHFHDDEKRVKVAIPVAEFWTAWNHFKNGDQAASLKFLDLVNKSLLTITLSFSPIIDVTVELSGHSFGNSFVILDSFAR